MNDKLLTSIILAPIISEKANLAAESANCVVFKVLPKASKPQIKRSVETLFNVKVDAVRVLNMNGKSKRFGRTMGRRSDWKKAYVTLKEGYDISFANP